MKPNRVFLGVGTNLGDRLSNLAVAQKAIAGFVSIERQSKIYKTAPWGFLDQPYFLNQVWTGFTRSTPPDLLKKIKQLETDLGREPSVQYGPRLIDIDILLYANLVFVSPQLVIPHPHISERAFVLAPLAELAPDLIIPGFKKTVRELLTGQDTIGIQVSG